jgi:hypothetical protein
MSLPDRRYFLRHIPVVIGALAVADAVTRAPAQGQVPVYDRVAQNLLTQLNQEADRTTATLRDIEAHMGEVVRSVGRSADARQVNVDLTTVAELRKVGGSSSSATTFEAAKAAAVAKFYAPTPQPDGNARKRVADTRHKEHQLAAINAFAAAEVVEASMSGTAKRLQELAAAATSSRTLLSDGDIQAELGLLLAAQNMLQQYLLVANTKMVATSQILGDDSFIFGGP